MKKSNLFHHIIFLLLTVILLTGCAETHQEAIASLDASTMYYHGVSDFSISGYEELPNIGYLIVEDLGETFGSNPSGAKLKNGIPYYAFAGPSDHNLLIRPFYPLSVKPASDNFFSLSEEIEFVGKGDKEKSGTATTSNSLYYLEVPVILNYNHKIANGHWLYGGLGLYAASGLFGHYSSTFDGKSSSGSLKFGPTADYNRMDYGIVLKGGYTFSKKFSAFLNYDFGIRNIYSPEDKLFNRSIGLNVAYRIK